MFERVILRATNGKFKGKEFVLENEGDYTLGRSRDCSFVLDDPLCLISRRHCLIQVHAPLVRIHDLGSRNGTVVNGANIGCRDKGQLFAQLLNDECPEHRLDHGDTLQIAGYTFEVEFTPKSPCSVSRREEIGKARDNSIGPPPFQCSAIG